MKNQIQVLERGRTDRKEEEEVRKSRSQGKSWGGKKG